MFYPGRKCELRILMMWNSVFRYAVDEAQTHAHNSAVAYCILLKTNKQKALELTLS